MQQRKKESHISALIDNQTYYGPNKGFENKKSRNGNINAWNSSIEIEYLP